MALSLRQIAELVGGEVVGDADVMIERVAPITRAQPGEITFVSNSRYTPYARSTKASAIIVAPDLKNLRRNLIVTPNPYLAYQKTVGVLMEEKRERVVGIHPAAVVARTATIGKEPEIGPCVVIEDGAEIGDRVTIRPGVFIGRGVTVGDETEIQSNTCLYYGVRIGKRCIIHSNVTIGSDGFGWAPDGKHYVRIPQVGVTVVGDDVSIGSGSIINRGALGDTTIGSGTKIDSLVIISHNVEVGEDCLLVSQVGISGTVKIGNHVTLGGQVGVAGHLEIGDYVQVAAQSGVNHSLAANGQYFGSPARPISEMKRSVAAFAKLPELRSQIRSVRKGMAKITALLDRDVKSMTKSDK